MSRTLLVAVVVVLAFAGAVVAGEETVTGTVAAAAADAPEAATIKAGDVTYKVTKDDKGKELAEKAKDKKVEAKGTVAEKDGAKWLTVTEYKIVE